MRSRSRVFLSLLAVLTVVPLAASPAEARPVNSFIDDDTSRYEPFIETAKAQGLIAGCNPPDNNRVCPHHKMTRGGMAIVLARALGVMPSSADHFQDDNGHFAESSIDGLIDAGVPMSCGKERVCPEGLMTRGQMAALITRAFKTTVSSNPAEYSDLDGSPFRVPLAQLAEVGALLACDQPVNQRLCPEDPVRKDEAVYAVVTMMGLDPVVPSSHDSDLPPLGFGDSFDELSLWDGKTPSSRNRVSLTNGGYVDTALRVDIPTGSHFGADFRLDLEDAADAVPEHLFFRYYVKLDPDWIATSHGKLPGFSGVYKTSGKGGYRSSPSDPGWSARMMFSPNHGDDSRVQLGYYVYHLGQERTYGDGVDWNEAGKLTPGEWYCLEGEVQLNSLGIEDGALRAWVDEVPTFDLSGLEFRRPNEPEIKIESFWFDVYYGGKKTAPRDLGLTIDEVIVDTKRIGCGAGSGTSSPATGDFNGDGYSDRTWWDACPGGVCFWVENSTWWGKKLSRHSGDSAWFNLDTHRLGLASGDVDGDGRTDIVYHGRCERSADCWRVHDARRGIGAGSNWGDDARFSAKTNSLILGDWNGDGLDDLAYTGLCGDSNRPCWRTHISTGESFKTPAEWGAPPQGFLYAQAADVSGDGLDDLVYQAPCDESLCWFAQVSKGDEFKQAVALGPAFEPSDSTFEWIDFDGDGTADIVAWTNTKAGSWIEVRYSNDLALSEPVALTTLQQRIDDVALRMVGHNPTAQAVVQLSCAEGKSCIRRMMAVSPERLVESGRFRDERWDRPGGPQLD